MEMNEEFRDTLCNYVESMIEEDMEKEKKDIIKKSIDNTTGNVINVNFKREENP